MARRCSHDCFRHIYAADRLMACGGADYRIGQLHAADFCRQCTRDTYAYAHADRHSEHTKFFRNSGDDHAALYFSHLV